MADENDIENGNSADDQAPSSTFDLLREINENKGIDQKPADPVTPAADATPAPTTPKTTDAPKPGADTKTSTQSTGKDSAIPADPSFVTRTTTQPKAPDDKSGQTAPAAPADKTGDDKGTAVSQAAYDRLSELTGGTIKSENDFTAFVEKYNELAAQAAEGFKPQFKSDKHKLAYEMLAKAGDGQELDVARRTLHTLALDTDKLAGKSLLFEDFLLDPDNSDLSREDAWDLFEKHFEKVYGEADQDPLVKRELTKAERKAKENIGKLQAEFKSSVEQGEKEHEPDPKVVANVKKAVDSFGGMRIAFSEDAADADMLNVTVDGPEEIAQLNRYVHDPKEFWKDVVGACKNTDGEFDYGSFVRTIYEFTNREKIKRLAFEHGQEIGKRSVLNKDRNSTTPQEKVLQNARVPQGNKKEAGSFHEAFGNAMAAQENG